MSKSMFYRMKQPGITPYYSFLTLWLLCIIFAVILKSRAFIFGYAISLYMVVLLNDGFKIHKTLKIISPLLLTSLFIGLTFFYKADSSSGRMLVYKLTWKIIKEHAATGVGLQNFANVYRSYQAAYFREGNYSIKELLLADHTQHAFNDYLQFIAEVGLSGVIFLLFALYFVFKSIRRALSNNNSSLLLLFACLQLLAISVAALFMHEVEKLYIQFVLLTSLFIVVFYAYRLPGRIAIALCISAISFVGLWQYGFYLKNYKTYQSFEEANNLYNTGYIIESLALYGKQYPVLHNQVLYLGNYARALNATNQNNEAILLLQRAIAINNSFYLHQQLATYYTENKMLQSAEDSYLKAIYMVPNRFVPRFHLFEFYIKSKQNRKALECGKSILNLPVKIPSLEVKDIQEAVRKTMDTIVKTGSVGSV
jgi:hypothetical protein